MHKVLNHIDSPDRVFICKLHFWKMIYLWWSEMYTEWVAFVENDETKLWIPFVALINHELEHHQILGSMKGKKFRLTTTLLYYQYLRSHKGTSNIHLLNSKSFFSCVESRNLNLIDLQFDFKFSCFKTLYHSSPHQICSINSDTSNSLRRTSFNIKMLESINYIQAETFHQFSSKRVSAMNISCGF